MIFLELFYTFFIIGAVTFGGGYAMLPLIQEQVLAKEWLPHDELINFIAVSESTPGPFAINIATYIGSVKGGEVSPFLAPVGSLCATLGVVLPSFIIILLVSAVIRNLLKFAGVKAALAGVRPAVVGLILATAVTLLLKVIFSVETPKSTLSFDGKGLLLFAFLAIFSIGYKKYAKKPLSPIVLILISGALGVLLYGFL
jgi:chromate transporter